MTLTEAIERQPTEIRPVVTAIVKLSGPERFVVLQPKAMPAFGFLIRENAEPRFAWEHWLTIRDTPTHVRIASAAGELDVLPQKAIGTACREVGITSLIIANAHAHVEHMRCLGRHDEEHAIGGVLIVDLPDYPLALLARYGTEVIVDALSWIDFDATWNDRYGVVRGPLCPRPITIQNLQFLRCHIAHLERERDARRRFLGR